MPTLVIRQPDTGGEITVTTQTGGLLSDILLQHLPAYLLPCGGRKNCGKCGLWAKGQFSPMGDEEEALLSRQPAHTGPEGFTFRLTCSCRIEGDSEVVYIARGEVAAAPQESIVPLPIGHSARSGALGAACDIGTTTITLVLYSLQQGTPLAQAHHMNQQGRFGADVLSRIEYSNQFGTEVLHQQVVSQLNEMLHEALAQWGGQAAQVEGLVITGNTTMLHYLAGLDPRPIGTAPFTPASLFGECLPAATLFPGLPQEAVLYLPPCISGYLGADISCGLLAEGFAAKEGTRLMVDIGTNGEMALLYKGTLLGCTTAAGPAFEGTEIAMGMPAVNGAIFQVKEAPGGLECSVVGTGEAIGICGTGLISAVDFFLRAGVVDGTGRMQDTGHAYPQLVEEKDGQRVFWLTPTVMLTQKDIRAVQLAKAAIAAGIQSLLHKAGIPYEEVDTLTLAGGFGSALSIHEAVGIGLIPAPLEDKSIATGNSALKGAAMLLLNEASRETCAALAAATEEIPLSSSAYFMESYMDQMPFYD